MKQKDLTMFGVPRVLIAINGSDIGTSTSVEYLVNGVFNYSSLELQDSGENFKLELNNGYLYYNGDYFIDDLEYDSDDIRAKLSNFVGEEDNEETTLITKLIKMDMRELP